MAGSAGPAGPAGPSVPQVRQDLGLAEYDRDLPMYVPIEDARRAAAETARAPLGPDPAAQQRLAAVYERIKAGYLPEQVDGSAFLQRVSAAIDDIVSAAGPSDTVVAFAHGGGSFPGASANVLYFPSEDVTVVVLSNNYARNGVKRGASSNGRLPPKHANGGAAHEPPPAGAAPE